MTQQPGKTKRREEGILVLFCGQPGDAVVEEVHAQRVEAGHGHIDAQVELVAVDQQRVVDVPEQAMAPSRTGEQRSAKSDRKSGDKP